ncbi:hypothetical protein [Variovorax sp. PCZ-1]|uniref:hypothetical protein n=1 Tax=Variovorax sp. PCZ-1 TaxID=2835533 RepID=UPI001BD140EB|nr:hypothetical protein [Variovorax sp. PCZ-1]MBS7806254.1 hypothetical protein [Variovorax sp. PCZ-1]
MNSALDASAWQAACDSYAEQSWQAISHPRAAYFASFGALHVAVAELLLERSDELASIGERRVVHIENTAGLLAVYSPSKRMVQLRAHNTALAQIARGMVLSSRIMPSSADLLDGAAAQGFQTWPIGALYWHYGQASLAAIEHLPKLAQHRMHIRRFPPIDPSALLMRQLHLIHLLSHHEPNFEQLLMLLKDDAHAFVCPDLASLHLTGTLRMSKA